MLDIKQNYEVLTPPLLQTSTGSSINPKKTDEPQPDDVKPDEQPEENGEISENNKSSKAQLESEVGYCLQ